MLCILLSGHHHSSQLEFRSVLRGRLVSLPSRTTGIEPAALGTRRKAVPPMTGAINYFQVFSIHDVYDVTLVDGCCMHAVILCLPRTRTW